MTPLARRKGKDDENTIVTGFKKSIVLEAAFRLIRNSGFI